MFKGSYSEVGFPPTPCITHVLIRDSVFKIDAELDMVRYMPLSFKGKIWRAYPRQKAKCAQQYQKLCPYFNYFNIIEVRYNAATID